MKRAALALILLFTACRFLPGSPEKTYEKFAELILQRHYDEAALMTDGLTADALAQQGSQERIGAGPAMFQQLFPSQFTIDGRDEADDALILHATQVVRFNPAGVESAVRPAMFATLRQTITMHKRGGAWKITAFENHFAGMDTTPR